MSDEDRVRWDRRYADRSPATADDVALPTVFRPFAGEFPTEGRALDIACGGGAAAVWLAMRGLSVHGCDVSPVAIEQSRDLAELAGCAQRCRFDVVDLDGGLPAGDQVEVLLCNRFRDPRLDRALVERLTDGGLLAISALSEVGASPGPHRAEPGELRWAFDALTVIASDEAHGQAWLLARR